MSRIQSHGNNVIDISDSDDEQAFGRPLQAQTNPFVAGSKRADVPWQAPVAPSRMVAVSDTAKLPTRASLGCVHSSSAPVPRISSNQGTPKPLMKVANPIDLTFSSDEDEMATVLPSPSARSTHPPNAALPRPQPRFIQPSTPSPPSSTIPLSTQKRTPTHNRRVSPAASPSHSDILVPGRRKRKRQLDGYQPGLIGFDDHHDTSNPADPNSDLPIKKRARLSIGGAKPVPAAAKNEGIHGLAFAQKTTDGDIGEGAHSTGLKLSEKENGAKGLRKNKAAPGNLKIFALAPCKEPENHDTVTPPTEIDGIIRNVASDNNADETAMDTDVDMRSDPPPRSRSPTPMQHEHTPRPPSLAREGPLASHAPSQRAETTQDVIDVLDYKLNLFWDEDEDADLQRALQLDCEVHSSPTVCAPSVIEIDDVVDFGSIPSTSTGLPYSGTAGVSGSWQCHDPAPNAEAAVFFIGDDLYEPSEKVSDLDGTNKKSEECILDPFASHVVDLHRQTIQEQLRVWADNPQADVSLDLANELVVVREVLAVRVAKRKFVENISGVARPYEKGDIERFIELNLKPIPSVSERMLDEEDVIPESPEVERQSTPEERGAVMSPSGVSGSGSSRLSTTPGALAIIDSDMKASDEGAGAAPLFAAKPELQEPTPPWKSAPSSTYLSSTESKSAHQEPATPSKCTSALACTTRTQSSQKCTEPAIEDLNNIMLKRLNLTPDALAQRKRPTWDLLAPFRFKALRLRAEELMQLQLKQEPQPDRVEYDEP